MAAPSYAAGQVVTYNGSTYFVNTAPPTGTPDTSPDYTALAVAGATGPTGPTESMLVGVITRSANDTGPITLVPENGTIPLVDVVENIPGSFTNSGGVVTINQPGYYLVEAKVRVSTESVPSNVRLVRNASTALVTNRAVPGQNAILFTASVFNEGDTVRLIPFGESVTVDSTLVTAVNYFS